MRRGAVLGVVVIGALAAPLLAFGTGGSVQLHLQRLKEGRPIGLIFANNASALVRLDPATLLPAGKQRLRLPPIGGWAYSPDRSRLVLGDQQDHLFIVDPARLRLLRTVHKAVFESVIALAWVDGRVIAVMSGFDTPRVTLIDPRRGRVLGKPLDLGGDVVASARTSHELVLLLAPTTGIGTCSIAVASSDGAVRTVALPTVRCGWDPVTDDGTSPPAVIHESIPGLAVDPGSGRAFVAPAGAAVTEVDLRNLTVSTHDLTQPSTMLGSVLAWLTPTAEAKGPIDGPYRTALWLGNGVFALWGEDMHGWIDGQGQPQWRTTAGGVTLIDTRTWGSRVLDGSASYLIREGDTLITTGNTGDSMNQGTGTGLTVYGSDGSSRFHLFENRAIWVQAGFGRAIVQPASARRIYWVVDLAGGSVVKTVKSGVPPELLAAAASP